MTDHHRPFAMALAGLTVIGAALVGVGPATADPQEPVPTPTPAPMADPAAPVADQVASPAPRDPFAPYVPEIQNPTYGSGNSGGGVFGTLKDLWHQVQNPTFTENEIMGTGGAPPPPGSSSAPALPPGYTSINFPGSETPVTSTGAGGAPAASGPALPPGYYPLTGPPPPGYQYAAPSGSVPAVPVTPTLTVPSS